MTRALLLTDLIASLGFGQRAIIAASVGVVLWWAYKSIGLGRLIGGVVSQWVRYGLAIGGAGAVGIVLGIVDPGAAAAVAGETVGLAAEFVGRYGDDAWAWLQGVLR